MTTHQIFVENIKCEGCINNIKTSLIKLKGVSAVEVFNNKVCISGNTLERDAIVKQLANIGYPEKGNNNFLSKAKSFITCSMDKRS